MSRLYPTLPFHSNAINAGEHTELELLKTLEQGLPDAYSLFHSVDWSRGAGAQEQHGEIDIVVVNQAGDVLLMEVKGGEVDFTADGIFKTYGGRVKNITRQVGLQYGAMRNRLDEEGLQVRLSHILVLPHLKVQTQTVQWPRERIVDSNDMDGLSSRIGQLLGPGMAAPSIQKRVLDFFANRFRVAPDVSALAGHIQASATRMSAGLATWVPRITSSSGLVRVVGTAGSGKTQLALRLLRDADAKGQKAAYICFNRALADHIALLAPVRTSAETFHEYALRLVRRAGKVVDFNQSNAFDAIATQGIALLLQNDPDLDLLVLDEMQDMQPEWVQSMLSRLKEQGKAVLLEDPEQQLYKDRVSFDLPDAVTISSNENFRTPRALVKLINHLQLTTEEIEALSAHEGEMPDPIVYETPGRVEKCTIEAVQRCLQRGFSLDEIAIVSMRGREKSVLQGLDQLGPWTLSRFTGQFDEGSTPIWKDGQLLLESVRRFKGQAAPAVVLTECDVTQLDPLSRRLLFVGLTRARVHLEWVISPNTAAVLAQTFGD